MGLRVLLHLYFPFWNNHDLIRNDLWTTKSHRVRSIHWLGTVALNLEWVVNFGLRFGFYQLLLHNLVFFDRLPADWTGQFRICLCCELLELVKAFVVQHMSLVASENHHLVPRFKLKRADRAN